MQNNVSICHRLKSLFLICLVALTAEAQDFLSVNWNELRIDSVLPTFIHRYALNEDYNSYEYNVTIEYPEFEKVSDEERIFLEKQEMKLPAWPNVESYISVNAKQGELNVQFVPLVWRDGCYQRITSLKLNIERKPLTSRATSTNTSEERYTNQSVLAQGKWVKIRVPATGIYKITHNELSKMGFSNPNNVRLYGQGGFMLSETNIHQCIDDLQEVPLYRLNSSMLFYAHGTISWTRHGTYNFSHQQNTYSEYAYYFLTENSEESPIEFIQEEETPDGDETTTYPDYVLYEKDLIHWANRGRIFLDNKDYKNNRIQNYEFDLSGIIKEASSTIKIAFASENQSAASSLTVKANEHSLGSITIPQVGRYDHFRTGTRSFTSTGLLSEKPTITLSHSSTCSAYLDYIAICFTRKLALRGNFTPFRCTTSGKKRFVVENANNNTVVWKISKESNQYNYSILKGTYTDGIYTTSGTASLNDEFVAVDVTATFPGVEFVGKVTNQNLHGLPATDMVIVLPTSTTWQSQAERLAELHRQKDSLRVEIVRADQIYNEFSSGTPDATAIRRFLKMFYDRAESKKEAPKYLLLFADCAADNRMITTNWLRSNPNDYLPCFQSENSTNETNSYILEDYFGLLDDNDRSPWESAKADIATGRLTVHSLEEATHVVDKIEAYMNNTEAGTWKNRICIMGDDEDNNNTHMQMADKLADQIERSNPNLIIEKLYWDAFPRENTATGARYPDITQRIKEAHEKGALMMNYTGHGRAETLSHEYVWGIEDMQNINSSRLPLWLTAACDTSPIDMPENSMGEAALINPKGGAIVMLGTARSTYPTENEAFNNAFCKHLFSGKDYTIGEALRLARNEVKGTGKYTNVHFVYLGDPAIRLALPNQYKVELTELNGKEVANITDENPLQLKAGSLTQLKGRIVDNEGNLATFFNGEIHPSIYDSKEKVRCKGNSSDEDNIFEFWNNSKLLFTSNDSVRNGEFAFTFPIPLDISYSNNNGAIYFYARNSEQDEAQGMFNLFSLGGTAENLKTDSIGPEIEIFFNTTDFTNNNKVNETPLLMLNLHDEDGINTTGNGVGHDLIAIVDNDPNMTYVLNNYYTSEAGDYTRGSVIYSMPELSSGTHTLLIRAWDVMNNSSTKEVTFEVVKGLRPQLTNVWCTNSNANQSTTFVITHNRPSTELTVTMEVFDFSGRVLWEHRESGTSSGNNYLINWNLTTNSGQPIGNGVYLYRATISSASGGSESSKTRKIAIVRQ